MQNDPSYTEMKRKEYKTKLMKKIYISNISIEKQISFSLFLFLPKMLHVAFKHKFVEVDMCAQSVIRLEKISLFDITALDLNNSNQKLRLKVIFG